MQERRADAAAQPREALWAELREHTRRRLGKDHYPHYLAEVPALARTASGKLIRQPPPHFTV